MNLLLLCLLAADWQPLFDGRTWQNWSLSLLPESGWWMIEDGWIKSRPEGPAQGSGQGRRLFTLESYRNFELEFTWRVEREGNSGVKYRVQRANVAPVGVSLDEVIAGSRLEPPTLESLQQGFAVGFEYQLTDDEHAPDALDSPQRATAALYRLAAARKAAPVRAGTEHVSRIRVVGWRFEHWLDGRKVLAGDLHSSAMRTRLRANVALAQAKLAQATTPRERYDASIVLLTAETLANATLEAAPIDFQHHRSGIAFRNIRIRRLP